VDAPKQEMQRLRSQRSRLQDYVKLKELHWDTRTQAFLDWGMHTEAVELSPDPATQVRHRFRPTQDS
jgi:hypothetical protein